MIRSGKIFLIALGLISCLFVQELYGQQSSLILNYSELSGGTITDPDVYLTSDNALDRKVTGANVYASLFLEEIYNIGITQNIENTVELRLTVKKDDNSDLMVATKELTITASMPEQLWKLDIMNLYDQNSISEVEKVVVEVLTPLTENNSTELEQFVHNNIKLKIFHEINYAIDILPHIDINVKDFHSPYPECNENSVMLCGRNQTFLWERNTDYIYPNYQIQILKLENTDPRYAYLQGDDEVEIIRSEIDWSKALTIETDGIQKETAFGAYTEMQLPLALPEGSGLYIWRVRPIGDYYEDGIADPRNWGEWTTTTDLDIITVAITDNQDVLTDAALIDQNEKLVILENPFIFYIHDYDQDMNYSYARTFSEDLKTNEVVIYADPLLNTRQTQTYLSTTDNKIVSHNVKDFKGNTAVEVLPIPKNGRLNEYEDELVKDGDGGLYNAFDFDLEPDDPLVVNYHLDAPSPITGDVNDYYSETNPDKQVPNAEGYPFSRTVVSNDPANKVIEQASPGRHHMLGAQTDDATTNMGRTIRTQYSTPSDAELVRVFGDEAPDCNNVLKVETIDPNNTKTISYISEEGKIIATCLSSNEGDDLLLNIDTYPGNNNNKFAVANSTSENTEIENGLVSVKNVSFSETTPISLDYTISCEVIEMLCVSIAGDCEYLVVFTISGLDNDYYLTDTVSLDTIDCLGDPMLKSVTWPFEDEVDDVDIQAGSYKFTKQLIVNGDLSDQVQTATADISDQIYPLVAMVSSWLTGVQNQGDLDQVYTNIDNFNTQIFEAWQSGDLPDNTTDPNNKFVILKQDFSLPVDFIFNSGHVLEKIYQLNSEDPPQTVLSSINIWGGCCGPISVPLFYENPFNSVCKEPAEYLADLDALGGPGTNYVNMETVGPDFEAYMLEQLQTAEWDDLMPGYRPGEFNRMIFHMLTDSYAPMGQTAEEPQYTCEELWGSWMALIAVFDSVEENMVGQYDMSEHTGEQYDPPSDEHQDNHYDINAGLYGGDLGDWLLNTALSIMVRDDEHNVTINAWLPELFLQDVGYKYARILIREQDGTFRPGWEPLAADQSEYFAAPYNIPNVYEEEYPDSFENLIYSNVYNPIFAFKYYEYTDHSYPDCEGAYCYWGPVDTDPLIANDGYGFCTQEPCLNLSYVNWNYTDARGFYDCIKDRDPFVAPDPPLSGLNSCTDVLAHEDYTQAALEANRLDLIDGCHEACEARKDQIFDYLYNLFEENCYRIDQPCPEDPDVISTADIWVIVDTLVNRCKNDYCPDPASASDFCYCKDWDVTCLTTDYVNRTLIPNSNYWELKYLSDCEAQKKEIISTWLLEIAIISQCPGGATTLPGWTDQTTCETKPASCYPSSTVDDPGNPVTSTQIDVESDVQY